MATITSTFTINGRQHNASTVLPLTPAALTTLATQATQVAPQVGIQKTTAVVVHKDPTVLSKQIGASYIATIYYDSSHYEAYHNVALYDVNGTTVARDMFF